MRSVATCPTCGETGFDGETGVRRHHTQIHDKSLANRECEKCQKKFYDKQSQRQLCDDCWQEQRSVAEKPDSVSLPDHLTWSSLTSYQRYYYKNREEEKERSNQRKQKIRQWYQKEVKTKYQCTKCGEDHPATIDFHHPDGVKKESSISNLISNSASKEKILDEIEQCMPLCANCHRKQHHSS